MVMVGLVAVMAFSAMVAGSASAASWKINGSALTGSAALATTAKVDATASLIITTANILVLCTGGSSGVLSGIKPLISSPNSGTAETLIFNGCTVMEPSTCTLSSEEITTEPLTAEVKTGPAPDDLVTFSPTKKDFTEIDFIGAKCPLTGEKAVSGKVTIKAPTGQTESVTQAIEGLGTLENNSLFVGSDRSYIEGGSALLKLVSGSKWSFA